MSQNESADNSNKNRQSAGGSDTTKSDTPTSDTTKSDSTKSDSKKEAPKRKFERVPKVFGKRGWMVVLLPYVIYFLGSSLGGYIDSSRAITWIHEQQHTVVNLLRMAQMEIASELEPALLQELRDADDTSEIEFGDEMSAVLARLNWNQLERLAKLPEELKAEDLTNASESFLSAEDDLRVLMRSTTYAEACAEIKFLIELLELDEAGFKRQILAKYYEHAHGEDGEQDASAEVAQFVRFQPDRTWYPSLYTINIAITTLVMFCVFPFYFRAPFKISWLGAAVGLVGIVVWIAFWWLDKNLLHLGSMLQQGGRAAFNPFEELKDNPTWMYQFLAIRFWGLVVVIPFIEEFFLRGWLMRYIDHPDWDEVPLGLVTWMSGIGVCVYAVFSHAFEPLAAVVWFSLVTWLYWKTESIWECVLAHAVTNLLLGLFVLQTGIWELW